MKESSSLYKRPKRWLSYRDPSSLDRRTDDMVPVPDYQQIEALANRLFSFGLAPWEVEVMLERDVMKLSLREIMDAKGYTSPSAVLRVYKLAYAKAKQGYLRMKPNA